jgi:ketosteroid isomerase-like protein
MTKLITAESLATVLLVLVFGFLVVLFTTDSFRSRPVGQRDSGFALFARRPRRRWPLLALMLVVALALGYLAWRKASEPAAAPGPTSTAGTVTMATELPVAAAPVAEPVMTRAQEPAVESMVDPAVEVTAAIEAWRAAWAARDTEPYLAAYAADFRPADGQTPEDWRAQRKDRLGKARGIRVQIEQLSIDAEGDRATARFLQRYRAGAVNDRVWKRLVLTRTPDGWKINEEAVEEAGKR